MKNQDQIHNRPELLKYRKNLRNNSTAAEATLWKSLKNSKLDGRKFRRQHSVGYFILDFYCPREKLCIELDGTPHFTQDGLTQDKERTGYLNTLNIKVLRFENKEVFENLGDVLDLIRKHFTN